MWSGLELHNDNWVKGCRWALLDKHELQWKFLSLSWNGSENLFKINLRTLEWGWPRRWCQVVREMDVEIMWAWGCETGHSYSPLLVRPCTSAYHVFRSFKTNLKGKNSIDLRLSWQNLETSISLRLMEGAHKVWVSSKTLFDEFNLVEPVWEIGILLPSPMETSSLPWYGCRLCGSVVMWWVAPESTIQGLVSVVSPAA